MQPRKNPAGARGANASLKRLPQRALWDDSETNLDGAKMNKKLKSGLSLHTHIDWRSGETVYTICDSIGAVYSTIFPVRLERFYEAA